MMFKNKPGIKIAKAPYKFNPFRMDCKRGTMLVETIGIAALVVLETFIFLN
jgi:hypothetical protein